jgi:nucleoid-associated protein YgaU
MQNRGNPGQGSRASASWLAVLGGCALSITVLCALVLAVLLMSSAAFNVYLAWTLSGYQVSVGRPTSEPGALVLLAPTGVLAIIPTPTVAPTSTRLPTATTAPTNTSTLVPSETSTRLPSPTPTKTRPKPEPATPTATATRAGQSGGAGTEITASSAGPPGEVVVGSLANTPTPETIPYVVQQGDTLWLIANTAYGSGRLWPAIFDANREVLSDPNQIQPDQVLRVPLNP